MCLHDFKFHNCDILIFETEYTHYIKKVTLLRKTDLKIALKIKSNE